MNHNNTDNKVSDASLDSQVADALNHDLNQINAEHAEEFSLMREKALEAIPQRASKKQIFSVKYIFGASAVVVAASLLLAVLFTPIQSSLDEIQLDDFEVVLEDFELEEGDLEILENDIEFYLWLAANEQA